MTDYVNSPPHYNTGNIECIDAIEESMTPEGFKCYLKGNIQKYICLLYTSPSPRDRSISRMPSSA